MSSVASKIRSHCFPGAAGKKHIPKGKGELKLPEGLQMPDKCGFCSFKFRCRKRDPQGKPGCFPVDADKKACGPDDCPGCGDVCSLPLMSSVFEGNTGGLEECEWNKKLMDLMKGRVKSYMSKMRNYWRRRGFKHIMKYMPTGSCKQVGDSCKCCCHPYEPSEDGSTCVVKNMCKLPTDLGMDWGPSEDFF
jgi:hypothetical protein